MPILQQNPIIIYLHIILFFSIHSVAVASLSAFVAPINKDQFTELYTIPIYLKTPFQSANLLIDLGGTFTWIDCTSDQYTSTSYRYVPCNTSLCYSTGSLACSGCFEPSAPGCHNNSCALFPENPLTRTTAVAQVLTDSLAVATTNGRNPGRLAVVPNFVFSCSDPSLLQGLPNGVIGLAGLGRSNIALPAQLSSVYASPYLFALCLPGPTESNASGSAFFSTGGPYYFSPAVDLSSHLIYTPLIVNPIGFTVISYHQRPSDEYFVGVTSINVNGKPVEFNRTLLTIDRYGFGGTRLSTITPYTVLHTSIYEALTEAFINESAALNLTVTKPVNPFGVCYEASDVINTQLGPAFPTIDLVMHSDDVYWRIFGANSMVRITVDDSDLWCLGFVNGGAGPRTSVVIGGLQMEDNLLQFDLVSKRLGFTSSVLVHNTSCADFNFTSNPDL